MTLEVLSEVPLLCLELVGHVLQQSAKLDGVLLEDGSTEAGEALQPEGDAGAIVLEPLLVCLREGFHETAAKHVVRETREVLQRVYHRTYQVVVNLDLHQHLYIHNGKQCCKKMLRIEYKLKRTILKINYIMYLNFKATLT